MMILPRIAVAGVVSLLVLHAYWYGDACSALFGGSTRKHQRRQLLPGNCPRLPEGPPRFRDDGTFTIVQFTDLHLQCFPPSIMETVTTVNSVLNAECPDFVAYTGDVCEVSTRSCTTASNQALMMDIAVDPSEYRGIPWAMTYGNWDRKPDAHWTGSELNDFLISGEYKHNFNRRPQDGVDGDSVFHVLVMSNGTSADLEDTPNAVMYFMDTMANEGCLGTPGTGCLHESQVAWYNTTSAALREKNGGRSLPAVALFHIPLPEYITAWNSGAKGDLDEPLGTSGQGISCVISSGGFAQAAAANGDVLAMTCGHDHDNDFHGVYQGISMMYGRKGGFGSYGPPDTWGHRPASEGARVIQLRRKEGRIEMESWIRLNDGRKIVQTQAVAALTQSECFHGS